MSKPALLLSLFFCLLSCNKPKETFHIDGYIDGATDGDSLIIARTTDCVIPEELAHCVVMNNRFRIEGNVEYVEPAYLYSNTTGGRDCTLFFIEKGEMALFADSAGCRVTGTPLNNLYSSIKDTIELYVAWLEEIEQHYYSNEPDELQLAYLSAQGLTLQERLVNYLRNVTRENIHTPLGLYLLVVYNELFTTVELREQCELVPPSIVNSSNIPFYKTLTTIIEERDRK